MKARIVLPALLAALAACDSSSTGSADGRVSVSFTAAPAPAASAASAGVAAAPGQLVLTGDNGVLTLTDLRVVVSRFRLRGDDDVNRCADTAGAADDCDDFDAGPLFITLPFDGIVTVAAGEVTPGTYDELEFRVKNLDDDDDDGSDDDAGEAGRTEALFQQIRGEVPGWPRRASMMVVGTFQPRTNGVLGAAQPFRVFARAELRARVALAPPLVVTDASPAPQVTITVDPALLFRSGSRVVNLAQSDGQLIELRVDGGLRGTSRSGSNSGRG
jgi:hypothetical protein